MLNFFSFSPLAAESRKNNMRYQLVKYDERSYDQRNTGNFIKPVYKFHRYSITQFIGIKCLCSIKSELHDQI